MRLLLDTNVWMDFFDADRAGHAVAQRLIRQAVTQGDVLLYSVGTSKDLYYLMRHAMKRRLREELGMVDEVAALAAGGAAWDCMRSLGDVATCVGADESDMWLAEKSHGVHRDYEDDLVIAAAQRAQADALVTSDESLLRHAPVAAMTPEDALVYFANKG